MIRKKKETVNIIIASGIKLVLELKVTHRELSLYTKDWVFVQEGPTFFKANKWINVLVHSWLKVGPTFFKANNWINVLVHCLVKSQNNDA